MFELPLPPIYYESSFSKLKGTCKFPGCPTRYWFPPKPGQRNKHFYRFPRNPKYRDLWWELTQIDKSSKDPRICEDHFEQRHFINETRHRLNANALPTAFGEKYPSNTTTNTTTSTSTTTITTTTATSTATTTTNNNSSSISKLTATTTIKNNNSSCIGNNTHTELNIVKIQPPVYFTVSNTDPDPIEVTAINTNSSNTKHDSNDSEPQESILERYLIKSYSRIEDPLLDHHYWKLPESEQIKLLINEDHSYHSKDLPSNKEPVEGGMLAKIGVMRKDLSSREEHMYKIYRAVLSKVSKLRRIVKEQREKVKLLKTHIKTMETNLKNANKLDTSNLGMRYLIKPVNIYLNDSKESNNKPEKRRKKSN